MRARSLLIEPHAGSPDQVAMTASESQKQASMLRAGTPFSARACEPRGKCNGNGSREGSVAMPDLLARRYSLHSLPT